MFIECFGSDRNKIQNLLKHVFCLTAFIDRASQFSAKMTVFLLMTRIHPIVLVAQ